ncbi:MAG: proton-conducting membrane transporter [Planctomycetes bacterium]|nr:proton-conducting membrane transporter [Planctomycetota bacterium]
MTSPYLPYLQVLAALVVALPTLACFLHGAGSLLMGRPPERVTEVLVATSLVSSFVATILIALGMALFGVEQFEVTLGTAFRVGDYAFEVGLLVDHLTIPFMALTTALLSLIGKFSSSYLHREPGFNRFFFLLLLFAVGMLLITMAGTVDLMFVGWEIVGVTSALLIGFFHERPNPARSALWAFGIYRVCDVALLAATILIHSATHSANYSEAFAPSAWPAGTPHLSGAMATSIGILLVFAALGKSAQVPFSGWLPRAMEGPTPSSAIFYGALSIHAGAYLLLRNGPILEASPIAAGILVAIGVITALHATFVGRVQTDIKSILAYASVTQVGLILAEIGMGLRILPLVHLTGHALLRTLQLLRSPSLLHERHKLQLSLASELPESGTYYEHLLPSRLRRWLYTMALERGNHDVILRGMILEPILATARLLERAEAFLGGSVRSGSQIQASASCEESPASTEPLSDLSLVPARSRKSR